MAAQENTTQFLENLQQHFNRRLRFLQEVGFLLDESNRQGLDQPFRDAMFQAKIATKTREVMNRIGREGEGFDKLSVEFQVSIEKVSTLLKTIVKESPDEIKHLFVNNFFSLDQAGFNNLLGLLEDLGWLKNWELDDKPLPLTGGLQKRSRQEQDNLLANRPQEDKLRAELARIRLGASFGFVLMILLFIVDPPVLTLGWGLAIVIGLLLFSIATASHTLMKNLKKHS